MSDLKIDSALKSVSNVVFCKTSDEAQRAYDEWSKKYDEEIEDLGCLVPEETAKMFEKHVKGARSVLDIGAGTGFVGFYLRKIGFEGHIDVLDANLPMLIAADGKGLNFRNILRHFVNEDGELPVKDGSYDVITCAGSFIPNHIPATALKCVNSVVFCKTSAESQHAYDKWSKKYDEDVAVLGSMAAQETREMFEKHAKDVRSVLDIGAGTGRVGAQLRENGFEGHIDLLDANLPMLIAADGKGLNFRNIFRHFVNEDGELPIKDETYDAITCAGSFIPNHIPATALKGVVKAVKRNGVLIFITRSRSTEAYKIQFDSVVDELVVDEKIKILDIKEYTHFRNTDTGVKAMAYAVKRLNC